MAEKTTGQIVDAKGKPIVQEIATTKKDIDIFSGWLTRLENPDPVLRTEAGGKGLKLYDEVDRDPHAGAVLQDRYLAVVGKDWDILPGKSGSVRGRPASTSREEQIADFVKETLEDCNFDQARAELLQAILYGHHEAEVMWQITDKGITIKQLIGKHPRRFSFTQDRELRLLTPTNMIDGEELPDRKFIVFTYGDSDNPYGKGLGRKLWWPVWFKKNGIKFWLVFLEKFGMPTTVGKYPQGTNKEDQDKLFDAIDAIHNETGVTIPEDMAIELLEAARQGKVTYETLCEYMDKQMSKAVLGQTATTEGTPGKLGNEEAQGEVRQDILEADADLLDSCLNQTLIKWLVDYNYPGVSDYPKIKTHAAPKPDLKERSEIDKTLVKDIGLPVGKKYFYETYNVDEPEEGEEIVKAQGAGRTAQGDEIDPELGPQFAQKLKDRFSQEDIDSLAQQGAKAAGEAIEVLIEPVLAMIEGAKSFEEIGEKIYTMYPALTSDQFQELLGRATFAAGLTGYASSQQEAED